MLQMDSLCHIPIPRTWLWVIPTQFSWLRWSWGGFLKRDLYVLFIKKKNSLQIEDLKHKAFVCLMWFSSLLFNFPLYWYYHTIVLTYRNFTFCKIKYSMTLNIFTFILEWHFITKDLVNIHLYYLFSLIELFLCHSEVTICCIQTPFIALFNK